MSPKRKRASRKEEFRKALTAPHALGEKQGREADALPGKVYSKLMAPGTGRNKTWVSSAGAHAPALQHLGGTQEPGRAMSPLGTLVEGRMLPPIF